MPLIPLADLVGSGDWRKNGKTLMIGYAQSWALFHLLMHERPQRAAKVFAVDLPTANAGPSADGFSSGVRSGPGPNGLGVGGIRWRFGGEDDKVTR